MGERDSPKEESLSLPSPPLLSVKTMDIGIQGGRKLDTLHVNPL